MAKGGKKDSKREEKRRPQTTRTDGNERGSEGEKMEVEDGEEGDPHVQKCVFSVSARSHLAPCQIVKNRRVENYEFSMVFAAALLRLVRGLRCGNRDGTIQKKWRKAAPEGRVLGRPGPCQWLSCVLSGSSGPCSGQGPPLAWALWALSDPRSDYAADCQVGSFGWLWVFFSFLLVFLSLLPVLFVEMRSPFLPGGENTYHQNDQTKIKTSTVEKVKGESKVRLFKLSE